MAEAEETHWWYRCLHFLVVDGLKKHFGPDATNLSIIDAGCGTGGLMKLLSSKEYTDIRGFDASPHSIEFCKSQNLNVYSGDILDICRNHDKQSADVIICNDVLYFFTETDRDFILKNFHAILKPGGILIMNLPVFKIFRGIHDKAVGIHNRFSREDVRNIIRNNKFTIINKRYWPFFLSPLIVIARFLQRVKLRLFIEPEIKSDVEMPGKLLNSVLYMITRSEFFILPWPGFGSSLFIILRKSG